jgi:hypothetical protein
MEAAAWLTIYLLRMAASSMAPAGRYQAGVAVAQGKIVEIGQCLFKGRTVSEQK